VQRSGHFANILSTKYKIMKKDTKASVISIFTMIVIGAIIPGQSYSQIPGVTRTDLQQQQLSIPGREVVQARVDIKQGVTAPRHSHPGEEIVYVLEGLIEYHLDGQAPKVYKAGEVLFIPAGVIHSAKNVGTGNAAELATYILEKGKPGFVTATQEKRL
jgi:quercetin dioxygenase-like cupin family protein